MRTAGTILVPLPVTNDRVAVAAYVADVLPRVLREQAGGGADVVSFFMRTAGNGIEYLEVRWRRKLERDDELTRGRRALLDVVARSLARLAALRPVEPEPEFDVHVSGWGRFWKMVEEET